MNRMELLSHSMLSKIPKCFLLDGQSINEPVTAHGPFVMNTPEEIRQAFEDYRAGRMGKLGESRPADQSNEA